MKETLYRWAGWLWIGLVAFLCADLTAAFVEQRLTPAPMVTKGSAATPTGNAPARAIPQQLVEVLTTHEPEPVPDSTATSGAPGTTGTTAAPAPTPVSLTLKGTILSESGLSIAMVQTANGLKMLTVGEEVDGMVLEFVDKNSAGFKRGSETVVLDLSKQSGAPPAPVAGTPPPVAVNTPVVPATPETASTPVKAPETMAEMREILNDTATASRGIKVTPVNRNNGPYGAVLEFRDPNNLLAAIGLRHGDILLNVNGKPLKTAEDMMTAYQEMRNSTNLTFEVDRNGQVVPVKFSVKE